MGAIRKYLKLKIFANPGQTSISLGVEVILSTQTSKLLCSQDFELTHLMRPTLRALKVSRRRPPERRDRAVQFASRPR